MNNVIKLFYSGDNKNREYHLVGYELYVDGKYVKTEIMKYTDTTRGESILKTVKRVLQDIPYGTNLEVMKKEPVKATKINYYEEDDILDPLKIEILNIIKGKGIDYTETFLREDLKELKKCIKNYR